MRDEELGTKILTLVCQTTAPNIRQKVGAAARELLTKPVATREEISKWMDKEHGGQWYSSSVILAALQHFAAPDRPKMQIEGMTVDEIQAAMLKAPMNRNSRDYAGTAHRLANTPAPKVDEDAAAKRLHAAYNAAAGTYRRGHDTLSQCEWDELDEEHRNGWRAVAKEVGGE